MATMSGGEIIAWMLKDEGVEVVFGIPDGTYLALCVALRNHGIKLITPRHETTAAHMAGAYARLTGKLGVCLASNGPGVANILPGVAVENGEGNRVLLITTSRRTPLTYPDRGGAYQYFDQVGVIKPMAKWSGCASERARIPELLRRALRVSYRGRPGVVHLDVPESLVNGKDRPPKLITPKRYRAVEAVSPTPDQIDRAAQMLIRAELPIIHAGSGIIHAQAYEPLARVAELLHAPVTTSWSARGVLDERHTLAWPMVHVKANNTVRNAADLALILGSRVGETDWWGKSPNWRSPFEQKAIQVDLDIENLGQNKPVDLAVVADVGVFLDMLVARLTELKSQIPLDRRKDQVAKLAQERDKDRAKLDEKLADLETPMITAHVGRACREVFEDDCVVVFDGGNAAVWGNFFFQLQTPNSQLATAHFGHLGAGLGQALGAAVARPDKQVCCIIGDGAFGFHPQEIETAVRNNLKIVFLVVSDKQWGMVKMTQQMAFRPLKTMIKKSLDSEELINPDLGEIEWHIMGRSMGAAGERVADPEELVPALERCLERDRCSVIHVDVDPVKHMWAPGLMHFKKMHQEPEG